jgi:hypothetical protein
VKPTFPALRATYRLRTPLALVSIAACAFTAMAVADGSSAVASATHAAASHSSGTHRSHGSPRSHRPVNVIFDTDLGGDCDDAAALALLNAAQDNRQAQLLAVMVSNPGTQWAAGTADAIDTYYHHGNIPIGVRDRGSSGERMANVSGYAADIAANFPNDVGDGSSLPNATALYRKILSREPDHSVTLAVTGSQSDLANLLASHADRYSRLSGPALVARKVNKLVMMGSNIPSGNEWNIELDPDAAKLVSDTWPTTMVYDGFEVGNSILTGSRLFTETPLTNPVREIYKDYVGEGNNRMSWDVTAAYFAAFGTSTHLFAVSTRGKNVIDASNGANAWTADPDGNARYLVKTAPDDQIGTALSDLFVQPPRGTH